MPTLKRVNSADLARQYRRVSGPIIKNAIDYGKI